VHRRLAPVHAWVPVGRTKPKAKRTAKELAQAGG
jgi:hypothetical protein